MSTFDALFWEFHIMNFVIPTLSMVGCIVLLCCCSNGFVNYLALFHAIFKLWGVLVCADMP